jgi:cytochrome d ubiquinol oxidase subunit I
VFDTVVSARALMGTALGFHINFTNIGIGLPPLLFVAEGLYLRTHKQLYRDLAKRWAIVTAVLFAIGAVSGTILEFAFGLFWPRWMDFAGGVIGLPLFLEGFAFFLEAIFLGIYLYGWDRLSAKAHWLLTIPITLSSAASAFFIISVNSWMNTPKGFDVVNGQPTNISPTSAMIHNSAMPFEVAHGGVAAYIAMGLAIGGVYAFAMLRGDRSEYNKKAMAMGLALAAIFAPLQVISGDLIARHAAWQEPEKFAAFEGQFQTVSGMPLRIGGIPFPSEHTTKWALEIPKIGSILAKESPNATIQGLDSFPPNDVPNVLLLHFPFQLMVIFGFAFVGITLWFWGFVWLKKRIDPDRLQLLALAAFTGAGFFIIELGWFVTEFGRQPWVIYHVMRTADGATPRAGIWVFLIIFCALYTVLTIGLAGVLAIALRRRRLPPPSSEVSPQQPEEMLGAS